MAMAMAMAMAMCVDEALRLMVAQPLRLRKLRYPLAVKATSLSHYSPDHSKL